MYRLMFNIEVEREEIKQVLFEIKAGFHRAMRGTNCLVGLGTPSLAKTRSPRVCLARARIF